MAERKTTRRTLLNWFLGTSVGALLAAVLYPVARFLTPPEIAQASANQVEAGLTNDPDYLQKGFKIIRFGAEPVIVIRVAEGDLRAFSAVCTHLSCIVTFREDKRLIWCYCHNGVYDLHGKNIAGPPPRPLTPYKVHVVEKGENQPGTIVVEPA